ncbi:MAG: ABC transporter permease, partial [Pseudomonadota bacterium]
MTRPVEMGRSLWSDAFRRLQKNRAAMLGAFVMLLLFLASFLGPWIIRAVWGYTYDAQN